MINKGTKKPFIPRNKLKSFVLFTIAALIGVLFAGPLMFAKHFWRLGTLVYVGKLLFIACWVVDAVMWIIFTSGLITARYRNIEGNYWQDQIW